MSSFLGLPILIRGRAFGNLYLTEKQGGEEFTAADERAGMVLAEWAAIAIENARLYESAESQREQLQGAVHRLEAMSEISRAVAGETDLDRILATWSSVDEPWCRRSGWRSYFRRMESSPCRRSPASSSGATAAAHPDRGLAPRLGPSQLEAKRVTGLAERRPCTAMSG